MYFSNLQIFFFPSCLKIELFIYENNITHSRFNKIVVVETIDFHDNQFKDFIRTVIFSLFFKLPNIFSFNFFFLIFYFQPFVQSSDIKLYVP